MSQICHFDNDLYFINEKISILGLVLKMEIDESFFFDKLIDDIMFLDNVIGNIHDKLLESPQIPNADSIYRNLMLTTRRYIDLLDNLVASQDTQNMSFAPFEVRFRDMASRHEDSNDRIQELLDDSGPFDSNEQVSAEEYQFLLQDDESTSDD